MEKITSFKIRARDLRFFLYLEIFTIPSVILIFKIIEPKSYAGIVAGVLFILIGSVLVLRNFCWMNYRKSPTFWVSCIHLFLIALPLFVFRILNFETPFEELLVFGIPGPILHKISEKIFTVLILSTFGELMYVRKKQATDIKSGSSEFQRI